MKKIFILFLILLNFKISIFAKEKSCNFFCKSTISLAFAFSMDKFIREKNLEHNFFLKDEISKYFEPFGRRSTGFYISSSALFAGILKKDRKLKEMAIELAEVNLLSGFLVNVMQKSFGRERPSKSPSDPHRFFKRGNSFPSSHSLHSFGVATILSEFYPKYKYTFYSFAFLSSFSRILDDYHWTSDVFFGAISGIILAKVLHKFNKKNKNFLILPAFEKNKIKLLFLLN